MRRGRNGIAALLLLAFAFGGASLARADGDAAGGSLPSVGAKLIPIIPVREREVWYRDQWQVRINGGFATNADLGQITTGDLKVHDENLSMIGIDVGRPIVNDFRDWPIDFAWRVGLIRYFEHGTQPDSFANTAYLKMFWRPFPWERFVGTRIGFGEGLSYAWQVPTIEKDYAERHGGGESRLLNYLDVSVDVNVGDIVRSERMRSCWLGVVISHRSGVFGLVDIFGNVHNGSNYNTAALECGF